MKDFKTIGEWLRYHRKQARMTQRELAALAGLAKTTISSIEVDRVNNADGTPIRPEIPTINALAKAFNVDPATPRLLAYPPEDNSNSGIVLTSGNSARLLDMQPDADIAMTIQNMRCEAERYAEIARKLRKTADDLEAQYL